MASWNGGENLEGKDPKKRKKKAATGSGKEKLKEVEASIDRLLRENWSSLSAIQGDVRSATQTPSASSSVGSIPRLVGSSGATPSPSSSFPPRSHGERPGDKTGARISDLNDQDKAKVAKLLQELVRFGQENEALKKEKEESRKTIEALKEEVGAWHTKYEETRDKFAKSLLMIKTYQEKMSELETIFHEEAATLEKRIRREKEEAELRDAIEIKHLKDQVERLTRIILEKAEQSVVLRQESGSQTLKQLHQGDHRAQGEDTSQASSSQRSISPIDKALESEAKRLKSRRRVVNNTRRDHSDSPSTQSSQLIDLRDKLSRLLQEEQGWEKHSQEDLDEDSGEKREGFIAKGDQQADDMQDKEEEEDEIQELPNEQDLYLLSVGPNRHLKDQDVGEGENRQGQEATQLRQRHDQPKEQSEQSKDDSVLEAFLQEQRAKQKHRKQHQEEWDVDETLDPVFRESTEHGILDPNNFENSQFDSSLFQVIEELESLQ